MKVCIAEKPSVAQSIAAVIGARERRQGYYEGGGYQVTWTFGHLCELKAPGEYTPEWRQWRLEYLPMMPPTFGISLKDDEGVKRQFDVIARLYAQADSIINCGDAGQEGELIQRWVMQKAGILWDAASGRYVRRADGVECPVFRLWISSMTDEAIAEGFRQLRPQQDYDRLYAAGSARAIGDWLLGMNATRLYTLRYAQPGQHQVISIGRVQTPTLALIVRRHYEIVNFQPQRYWTLRTLFGGATFSATRGRYESEDEARAALAAIMGQPFVVGNVQRKAGREAPPRLYDLTSLQVACNKRYHLTAEETLRVIQSLYEKKLTTYPRVDTTYLPDDIYPKVPNILRGLAAYAPLIAPLIAPGAKLPKSKKVFDTSKVTDHHAIIPTGVLAAGIGGQERLVYDLVARRFIAAFYPDCRFNTTTVMGETGGVPFKATGRVVVDPGWRVVYADMQSRSGQGGTGAGPSGSDVQTPGAKGDDDTEESEMQGVLPDFKPGDTGPHEPSLQEGWTQPPKLYTEATLLRAMETAGRLVDDEALRDALKENGLGRPSTRAAIIETLFKRRYIRRERSSIVATETGLQVIGLVRQELLKSAELTGQWERKLRQIERGEGQARDFLDALRQMVVQIVAEVKCDVTSRRVDYVDDGTASAGDKKGRRGGASASGSSAGSGAGQTGTSAKGRKKAAPKTEATAADGTSVGPKRKARSRKTQSDAAPDAVGPSVSASASGAPSAMGPTMPSAAGTQASAGPASSSVTDDEATSGSGHTSASAIPSTPVGAPRRYTLSTLPQVCPQCGQGHLIRGHAAYGCSNFRNGCHFVIPFSQVDEAIS